MKGLGGEGEDGEGEEEVGGWKGVEATFWPFT